MAECAHTTISEVPMASPWVCRACGECWDELPRTELALEGCLHPALGTVPMLLPFACRDCGGAWDAAPRAGFRDPAYYHQGKPQAPSWPAEDPKPVPVAVVNWPSMPRAVVSLQKALHAAGWVTLTNYARAEERAVKVGTYKLTESWALWTDWANGVRICAVYSRTVGAKTWAWRNTAIWPIQVPGLGSKFVDATVTDLLEFVQVRGSVLPAWFKGVHARVQDQATKAKARTAKTTKEGES